MYKLLWYSVGYALVRLPATILICALCTAGASAANEIATAATTGGVCSGRVFAQHTAPTDAGAGLGYVRTGTLPRTRSAFRKIPQSRSHPPSRCIVATRGRKRWNPHTLGQAARRLNLPAGCSWTADEGTHTHGPVQCAVQSECIYY